MCLNFGSPEHRVEGEQQLYGAVQRKGDRGEVTPEEVSSTIELLHVHPFRDLIQRIAGVDSDRRAFQQCSIGWHNRSRSAPKTAGYAVRCARAL